MIPATPVATARGRAAWVQALEQLSGRPPARWEGPKAKGDAIAEGRAKGDARREPPGRRQTIAITNRVRYLRFVELGTRKMRGRHPVRRSMLAARERLRRSGRRLVRMMVGAE